MAAEGEEHSTGRCNRCGDASQQQRILVSRPDEEIGYPHRVWHCISFLFLLRACRACTIVTIVVQASVYTVFGSR